MFKEISLHQYDPELATQIDAETKRQEDHIELIASENYCSPAVMQAQGSTLTNKYAEGYPKNATMVVVSMLMPSSKLPLTVPKNCLVLIMSMYNHIQVQVPTVRYFWHYLSQMTLLLGMSLAHGGHLTHGASVNFSGRNYHAVQYGLDTETGLIDYEEVARLAREHKPKMIIAGFSAYSQIIDWQKFRDIADEVGAYLMADMAHVAGLVATGIYPSPVQIADVTTTTTHKTLRGPRSGLILAKANEEIEKKLASAVFPGSQGGPLMHAIAAKAVCFKRGNE